ncbi:hypothetical protein UMM65_17260 [Aureibaculum sp. 2210JD6-5]|uniref:hypothetical protein n=1 Tax=Aureibaculum sp. 2210JD6-5 TaxID=3103957 RepID=UPI002AAE9789|nr:hypothetical protein [Aureibaculum sp. 2210JD6-5]MDY7396997.1 hypothetical protein [Aureibaculum sp. 2210JD6-5]
MDRLFLFSIFFIVLFFSFSQTYKGVVKHTASQESIPFATVAVYKNINLVDGVSTNDNGEFELKTQKNV